MTVASFSKRAAFACLLVFALSGGSSTATAAETTYTVEDIGTLVGTGDGQFDELVSSNPFAIDERGNVVANAMSAAAPIWSVAFLSYGGQNSPDRPGSRL